MGPFIRDRINPLGYDEGSGVKCCDCQEVSGVSLCFVLTVESVEEYLLSPLVAFIAFSCAPGAHVLLHNQGRLLDEFRASLYALANSQQFIYIVGTFRIMPVSPAGDIRCSATARGQWHTCQQLLKDNPGYLFTHICGSSEVGPTLGSIPKLKVLFSFFLGLSRLQQSTACLVIVFVRSWRFYLRVFSINLSDFWTAQLTLERKEASKPKNDNRGC